MTLKELFTKIKETNSCTLYELESGLTPIRKGEEISKSTKEFCDKNKKFYAIKINNHAILISEDGDDFLHTSSFSRPYKKLENGYLDIYTQNTRIQLVPCR